MAEGERGNVTFANQNAAAQVAGLLLQQADGYQGPCSCPTAAAARRCRISSPATSISLVVQAAAALPQVRAGTIKAFANLSREPLLAVPDIPTADEAGVPGLLHVGLVRVLRAQGHAEGGRSPSSMPRWSRRSPIRPCKARFADLGLDIAPREQQTPEGLAAFHKTEIEKWWPIIKAAGIKVE